MAEPTQSPLAAKLAEMNNTGNNTITTQDTPDTGANSFNVYYHKRAGGATVLDPLGNSYHFIKGRFITNLPAAITFLDAQIAAGNSFIYTKKGEETLTSDELNPMATMKREIIEQYKADVLAGKVAGPADSSYGNPSSQNLNIMSTAGVASMSAGSDSVPAK